MASENEVLVAIDQARLKILKRIDDQADEATAETLTSLAEAYAWLTSPAHPH